MQRRIIQYPNMILRQKSNNAICRKDLENIDTTELLYSEKVWSEATELLMNVGGAALAAPQVGVLSRWFITNQELTGKSSNTDIVRAIPPVIINPCIVRTGHDKINEEEGCLSFPGITMHVTRLREIRVAYSTILHWGSSQKKEWIDIEETYVDFWARVFQHEIDHLDGKLFVDALPTWKRLQIVKKLEAKH